MVALKTYTWPEAWDMMVNHGKKITTKVFIDDIKFIYFDNRDMTFKKDDGNPIVVGFFSGNDWIEYTDLQEHMAYSDAQHIIFETKDLLSKWGFDDGGLLDDIIEKYFGYLLCNQKVLSAIIKRFVIPYIKDDIEVSYKVSISHNPVRISKINGIDISDCWCKDKKPDIYLPKIWVNIPTIVLYIKENIQDFFMENDSIIEIVGEYGKCEGLSK